ncbi:MAG: hypothetical protein H6613_02020 [Ignavibacteriales bacterium]|nr:hypothetical protein [Ignavibacteriales bacterium]
MFLFNASPPHEFVEYKYFNTLEGGENITNYIHFLDTLTTKYLVAIAISDEGSPRSEELKIRLNLWEVNTSIKLDGEVHGL